MRKGTYIEGKKVQPVSVSKVKKNVVSITVMEGKKHEVRLLVARTGLNIARLKRVRLGNLQLGTLPRGAYRILTAKEKASLFEKKSSYKKLASSTL
jgi:pseudouridine synthase